MSYTITGPCTVTYDGVDLGTTQSGIVIDLNIDFRPITDDKIGRAPANVIFSGKTVAVSLIGEVMNDTSAAEGVGYADRNAVTVDGLWVGDQIFSLRDEDAANVIGQLASNLAAILEVTERDGSTKWIADKAVAMDPDTLALTSVQELQVAITFLLLPNSDGKFFSTIPTRFDW